MEFAGGVLEYLVARQVTDVIEQDVLVMAATIADVTKFL